MDDCAICAKHQGGPLEPPGGWLMRGEHFLICHAPLDRGPAGTMVIESRRHLLDVGEMTVAETTALAGAMRRVFPPLKLATDSERLYVVATGEGAPHFHIWLVPRHRDEPLRGLELLGAGRTAEERDAVAVVAEVRRALGP